MVQRPAPARRGTSINSISKDNWCTPETFQDHYSPVALVEVLSGELVEQSKEAAGPFNARPFIRSFEAAIKSLQKLRKDLHGNVRDLESTVQIADSAYGKKLNELNKNFDAVGTSFSGLEEKITEIGRVSVRVGEQLETIDKQRRRALEAHALIQYYYQFARGDSSQLDAFRKEGGREGRLKTAVIARRLQAISREIDVEGAQQTRDEIDRYCERFERDMLKLFDKFYRKSDPKMMAHIAKVLQNFNGGHSCVQLYVNQHDFFISKDRVLETAQVEESDIWNYMGDPDAAAPKEEPSLTALFDEIRRTVEMEAQIIAAVFPTPALVLQTFLQRIFAQSIQGHIEVLMERAQQPTVSSVDAIGGLAAALKPSFTDLAFLRTLQLARFCTIALVNTLKSYDSKGAAAVDGTAGALARQAPDSATALSAPAFGAPGGATLSLMLDNAVEELFVPYMEGSLYIDREQLSLTKLYNSALARFNEVQRSGALKAKAQSTLLGRVRDAANVSTSLSSSKNMGSALSKLSGLMRGNTATHSATTAVEAGADEDKKDSALNTAEDATDAEDGLLNLDMASKLLRWHGEAVGRCIDLSPAADLPKNVFALLRVLSNSFNKGWVEVALETALASIPTASESRANTLPFLAALEVLHQVELITALWHHYVVTAILPLVSSSMTHRREIAIFNNHNMLRIEGKCEAVLQKLADNITASLAARLSTQRRADFSPKNDDLALASTNTEPCLACVELLERVQEACKTCLSGTNYETFCTEVGVVFHSQMLDHLKKFPVSAAGGLVLTKDLAVYQDAISGFGIPVLVDRFEMLRQLGNLFIVQPSVLRSYMQESHLASIELRHLRPYLAKRNDYQAVKGLGDSVPSETFSQSARAPVLSGSDPMQGLASLMRDLEARSHQQAQRLGNYESGKRANAFGPHKATKTRDTTGLNISIKSLYRSFRDSVPSLQHMWLVT